MTWIISIALALIICGAIILVGRSARAAAQPGSPERFRGTALMAGGLVLLVVWVGAHTALASIKPIEAGHVGVVYEFGEIVGQKPEGLQFIAPWQELRTANVRVQRHRFENVTAFSQETQDVVVVATVNYSISPSAVQQLYRTVGPNWFDILIEPRVNNFFKEETVKYQTVDVGPNREVIRSAVRDRLRSELQQYSIDINDLLIDNIDFRPEFKDAIEQKQIATQDALREQERVAQAEFEAQQAIARAEGEAGAILARAEGQAEANRLLAESLTPEVIQFQALQQLGDNIQIALIPSGQGIILDPTTLLGGVVTGGSTTPQLP